MPASIREDERTRFGAPFAELPVESDGLEMRSQPGRQARAQRHEAILAVFAGLHLAGLITDRALDVDDLGLEVDVFALERRGFAPPKAGERAQPMKASQRG